MSDGTALLAAILASPADDSVRLVYADWLQENGQPERAEFIRVQVELASIGALPEPACVAANGVGRHASTFGDVQCAECWRGKRHLFGRQAALAVAHRDEWLPKCHCVRHVTADHLAIATDCPTCSGAGHAGECRRGFCYSVPVRLGDVFERFPRIEEGVGDTLVSLPPVWGPTRWALDTIQAFPTIERIPLTDRPCWREDADPTNPTHRVQFGWWENDNGEPGYAIPPLFEAMWQEWKASQRKDFQGRWLIWDLQEDADDAMAEAVVKVIRGAR